MTDDEIARLRSAANLAHSLPDILPEVAEMENTVRNKVFMLISKGQLTADMAVSYWMELYGYQRLRTRLTDKAQLANQVTQKQ